MTAYLTLIYGGLSYALAMASFVYLGASLLGIGVPNAIDAAPSAPLAQALLVDALLVLLFALQHSVMARPGFKQAWTRIVPTPVERSTYVLASAGVLTALLYYWQPLGGELWRIEAGAGYAALVALNLVGWLIVVGSTFAIDHFDLFGLRQVFLRFRGIDYAHLPFATPGPYRLVRHPIYVGWLIVFWAAPVMTIGHLVLAGLLTLYILLAIRYEERDLRAHFGALYVEYSERVPRLIPGF